MGQEKGKTRGHVKFDPSCWKPDMIDRFLDEMARSRYDVGAWSRNAGVYIDWDRENALHREVHRKREVAKGEGRGDGPSRSYRPTDNWTRMQRPRR